MKIKEKRFIIVWNGLFYDHKGIEFISPKDISIGQLYDCSFSADQVDFWKEGLIENSEIKSVLFLVEINNV